MRKRCCGIGGQEHPDGIEHIGALMARALKGVIAMSEELEKKLAGIKNCPEPCDDGTEGDAITSQAAIRGAILKRYDMKLPAVITTSLTMPDIDARYGNRIADRLTEDIGDGGRIIDCGRVSLRNPDGFFAAGGK
jgi:hypothetical protein